MDDATVQILLKAKQEGMDAIKDMKDQLADLRRQAAETNFYLRDLTASSALTAMATEAMAASMGKLTPATQGASTAASAAQFSFLGMSGAVLALVGVITTAVAILSPFILLVAGAVVITTAFAVGVTAVTLALVAAFGPLAALTAGVIMLADRMFTTGKTAVDPLLQIEQALGKVADAWGKQATPMANAFLAALMPMIPLIQQIGTQALTWFGANMPVILQIMTFAAKALFDAIELGGKIFNTFFQAMAGNKGTFESFFGVLLTVGLQAVNGLLTNLLALSDWFMQRLPSMGPIVGQIFSAIGSFIQGVGKVAGEVVDWFIKNWPAIEKTAQQTWDLIRRGWNEFAPVLQRELPLAVGIVLQLFEFLHQHSSLVRDIFLLLGIAAAVVVGAIIAIGVAVVGALAGLQWLYDRFNDVNRIVGEAADAIGRFLDALSHIPGGAGAVFGGTPGGAPSQRPTGVRDAGGPVEPGGVYAIGAGVSETLTMFPGGGGYVTPGGGGMSMRDTNDLLTAIHARLASIDSKLGGGMSTAAYTARA